MATTPPTTTNTTGILTNSSTVVAARSPTTTTAADGSSIFETSGGGVILAFLILMFLLLLAAPVAFYFLNKRLCWVKVHPSGEGHWTTGALPPPRIKNKKTQTDVTGQELDEFFRRRERTDMSKYVGKEFEVVETPPRWHDMNPTEWSDPWSAKFADAKTNYVNKAW